MQIDAMTTDEMAAGPETPNTGRAWPSTVALSLAMLAVGLLLGAVAMLFAQGARGICHAEDSPSCVWFGPLQGNRHGAIVVNGPG